MNDDELNEDENNNYEDSLEDNDLTSDYDDYDDGANNLKKRPEDIVSDIKNGVSKAPRRIRKIAEDVKNNPQKAKRTINKIKKVSQNTKKAINKIKKVPQNTKKAINKIKNAPKKIKNGLKFLRDLKKNGLKNTVKESANKLMDKASNSVENSLNSYQNMLSRNKLTDMLKNSEKVAKSGKKAAKSGEKAAKSGEKATKAAKKAGNASKIAGIGTIFGIIILLIVLIGIVCFFFIMPGIVKDKILETLNTVFKDIKGFFNGQAEANVDEDMIKDLANYIEDMGYNLEYYGFAKDVSYYTEEDKKNGIIPEGKEIGDVKTLDLEKTPLFSYLIANERNYLIGNGEFSVKSFFSNLSEGVAGWGSGLLYFDEDSLLYLAKGTTEAIARTATVVAGVATAFAIFNWWNPVGWFSGVVAGVVALTVGVATYYTANYVVDSIEEILDSLDGKFEIDRATNSMIVTKLDSGAFSKYTYSLENWIGRYGYPIEFLLSMHLATGAPEFVVNEIAKKETKVELRSHVLDTSIKIVFPMQFNSGKTVWLDIARLNSEPDHYIVNDENRSALIEEIRSMFSVKEEIVTKYNLTEEILSEYELNEEEILIVLEKICSMGITDELINKAKNFNEEAVEICMPYIESVKNHWYYKEINFQDEDFTTYQIAEFDEEHKNCYGLYFSEPRYYKYQSDAEEDEIDVLEGFYIEEIRNQDYIQTGEPKVTLYSAEHWRKIFKENKYFIYGQSTEPKYTTIWEGNGGQIDTSLFAMLEAVDSLDAEFLLRIVKELFSDNDFTLEYVVEQPKIAEGTLGWLFRTTVETAEDGSKNAVSEYTPTNWTADNIGLLEPDNLSDTGFEEGIDMVSPGNGVVAKILKGTEESVTDEDGNTSTVETDSTIIIKLKDTGDSEADGVCISISGLQINSQISVGSKIQKGDVIGTTKNSIIKVIMKNKRFQILNNIDGYIKMPKTNEEVYIENSEGSVVKFNSNYNLIEALQN